AAGIEARTAGNWMLADVARLLNAHGHGYDETPLTPERLVGLLRLIDQGRLSGRMAKEVLDRMYETGAEAAQVVEELGLAQISDEEALRPVVEAVLAEHAKVVADVLAGKDKALGFLVGQVMKRTRGQASPETVNRLLRAAIAARSS
ncbi:MAG: Asp-tRNA(Asn)/Glu-tRNA(Gln) amidotransferase GatCAB subunit B, partial [Firmicutes bacterium]|nr:Asp-tRNA(Asn)/Glu-tRNA(Gln) amidotransferase GatCAB subunit B [Bacillota bacterium]